MSRLEELQSLGLERDLPPGLDQFAELLVRVFAPVLTLRGAEARALARTCRRVGLAACEAPEGLGFKV